MTQVVVARVTVECNVRLHAINTRTLAKYFVRPLIVLQGHVLQALAVALQHPAIAEDQRSICTLLQVNRAWNAAIQKSAASMTHVSIYGRTKFTSKVTSLSQWLAKNPGLVGSVDICYSRSLASSQDTESSQTTRQLLELSFKAAKACSGTGAALRLRSFKSSVPASAGLLAALPAATLTYLEFRPDQSNWFSTIGALTRLCSMHIDMAHVRALATDDCLREIGKLQQLTQLQLRHIPAAGNVQLLPAQLQHLELHYQKCLKSGETVVPAPDVLCDLQHLTGLQQLSLDARQLAAGSSVPPGLRSLELKAVWPAGGELLTSNLQQLTSVTLDHSRISSQHLQTLRNLPQLKDLSLVLSLGGNIDELGASWQNLPLSTLYIQQHSATPLQLQGIIQHVCAATQLTDLHISIQILEEDDGGDLELPLRVCEHLSTLVNLKSLGLSIGGPEDSAVDDAQHLTALSRLTFLSLCIGDSGPCVDGTSLCLLALSLTGLEELYLGENVGSGSCMSALPAIARLTALKALDLTTMDEDDARRGLQLLTGLSRLTRLGGFEEAGQEALGAFWDIIRSQQR